MRFLPWEVHHFKARVYTQGEEHRVQLPQEQKMRRIVDWHSLTKKLAKAMTSSQSSSGQFGSGNEALHLPSFLPLPQGGGAGTQSSPISINDASGRSSCDSSSLHGGGFLSAGEKENRKRENEHKRRKLGNENEEDAGGEKKGRKSSDERQISEYHHAKSVTFAPTNHQSFSPVGYSHGLPSLLSQTLSFPPGYCGPVYPLLTGRGGTYSYQPSQNYYAQSSRVGAGSPFTHPNHPATVITHAPDRGAVVLPQTLPSDEHLPTTSKQYSKKKQEKKKKKRTAADIALGEHRIKLRNEKDAREKERQAKQAGAREKARQAKEERRIKLRNEKDAEAKKVRMKEEQRVGLLTKEGKAKLLQEIEEFAKEKKKLHDAYQMRQREKQAARKEWEEKGLAIEKERQEKQLALEKERQEKQLAREKKRQEKQLALEKERQEKPLAREKKRQEKQLALEEERQAALSFLKASNEESKLREPFKLGSQNKIRANFNPARLTASEVSEAKLIFKNFILESCGGALDSGTTVRVTDIMRDENGSADAVEVLYEIVPDSDAGPSRSSDSDESVPSFASDNQPSLRYHHSLRPHLITHGRASLEYLRHLGHVKDLKQAVQVTERTRHQSRGGGVYSKVKRVDIPPSSTNPHPADQFGQTITVSDRGSIHGESPHWLVSVKDGATSKFSQRIGYYEEGVDLRVRIEGEELPADADAGLCALYDAFFKAVTADTKVPSHIKRAFCVVIGGEPP